MKKEKKKIVLFEGKKVRRTMYEKEWYFSIIDVIEILTESSRSRKYWSDLKKQLIEETFEVSDFIGQLKLPAEDGKMRFTDCANTETILRIIQSIPSKKAEPFKLWLAKVGYDRIKEIENPELAQKRIKQLYRAKGYSDEWIEKRVRGIAVRQELTDEWSKRRVENRDYGILTNEISKAAFGMTTSEYKKHKNLKRQNLRDHMNDLKLIFNMLGEASTTEIARSKDAQGFVENKNASKKGGEIAGNARGKLEKASGRRVISEENYIDEPEKVKRKRLVKKKKPISKN